MMDSEYIIHSYSDTLYSCLMPHEKQFEYRMPNHSIIYVRSGELTVEQKGTEVTIDAGNYVFVRRNCTARITKKIERCRTIPGHKSHSETTDTKRSLRKEDWGTSENGF